MIELNTTNLIGFAAAVLSAIKLMPQVIKVLKTKSAKDLSLFTFVIWVSSSSLYCIYGYRIGSLPVMISNGAALAFTTMVVALKLFYRKNR